MHDDLDKIFENGSRTFYNSSLFFPKKVRNDIVLLYAFVRTVDNFVDRKVPRMKEFNSFVNEYRKALKGGKSKNPIINKYIELSRKHEFEQDWNEAFLKAMKSDIHFKSYKNLEDVVENYIYGSAEVIGLMIAKIFGLAPASYKYARDLGKAFQYINFIRDIAEDNELGRAYFPVVTLKKFGLKDLKLKTVKSNPEGFSSFIKEQIKQYRLWQKSAEPGYKYIPKYALIPIKTAAQMYSWTANVIESNPQIIFEKKVKPSRLRIFATGIKNYLTVTLGI